jgi:GTP-binding protein
MHDRAKIHVQAGAGGDGCMSFRREAHVPRGGPDGGDGGHGGDVVLVCDASLRDLRGLERSAHYHAGRGGHGQGALRHGAAGRTLTIGVPPGTEALGADHDDLEGRRWELLAPGQRARIARGGPGGRGNKRFASATRQAPRFAERGLLGEEGWIGLQLRLLADVGLVGMPNAGKSSLLSRLTRATPKVASYPFTTLSPVLGVLEDEVERRQLVVADIPGLIEGASAGAGLGHDFLAHIERTRLLVHVLDVAPQLSAGEGADPVVNHAAIERELRAHDARLAELPRILALAKVDLLTPERSREAIVEWRSRLGPEVPVVATSSATGAGVAKLGQLLLEMVPDVAAAGATETAQSGRDAPVRAGQSTDAREQELAEHMVLRPGGAGRGFAVERVGRGAFAVSGRGIERLLQRYDIDNEDALAYVEERLRRIGVLAALEEKGFEPGDELRIGQTVFEFRQ